MAGERSIALRIAVQGAEEARARLLALGSEGADALKKIEGAAPGASTSLGGLDQASTRAGRAARGMGADIAQAIKEIAAGADPVEVLTRQLGDAALRFGAIGLAVGTAVAVLGGLYLALRDNAEAAEAAARAQEALDDVLVTQTTTISSLVKEYRELTEEQRGLAVLQAQAQIRELTEDLSAQREQVVGLAEDLSFLAQLQVSEGGLPSAVTNEQILRIRDYAEALEAGQISANDLAAEVARLAELTDDPRVREIANDMLGSALATEDLKGRLELAQQALALFSDESGGTAEKLEEQTAATKRADAAAKDLTKTLTFDVEAERRLRQGRSQDRIEKDREKAKKDATRAAREVASEEEKAAAAAAKVADLRREALGEISLEVEQLERLAIAQGEGEEAARAVALAIEIENEARKVGIDLTTLEGERFATEITLRANLKASIEESIEAREAEAKAAERQLDALKAMNDEELKRRSGQITAGGLSAPGEDIELLHEDRIKQLADEDELSEPFKNALQSVQNEFTTTFDEISRGTIRSFEDMAASIHGIFTNMNANLLSLAIFEPGALDEISGRIRTDTGLPVSSGLLGGAAAATPLIGLASGLFGNQGSQQGISFGGAGGAAIGGIAGSFFGPGGTALGAIGGGLLGSIGGGILGGFFGGSDKDKAKGTVSGSLGSLSRRGEGLGEITDVLREFDDSVLQLLNDRQRELVDASFKRRKSAVEVNFKGELTEDVIRSATGQRARAIGTGLGLRNIESAGDIGTALQTQRAIEDLTDSVHPFKRQIKETTDEFVALRSQARRFGISFDGLSEAQGQALRDLRRAQDAAVLSLFTPFEALANELGAFQKELQFVGLNPAEQAKLAEEEFRRIAAEAAAGSTTALQQIDEAGRLFIHAADAAGASPAAARAQEEVARATRDGLAAVKQAQEEASQGFTAAVDRARKDIVDTLEELIGLTRTSLKRPTAI